MRLVSPTSGRELTPNGAHALTDGAGERWPVVDGIPFLRAGREELAAAVLALLDSGEQERALVLLLADQDDWWTGPATNADELRVLVQGRHSLSLRDAMTLLRLGPVADYFAYRWSDPTFVGALALLEAHWADPSNAFELACGIGHFLRELTMRGVDCLGADVVFAKCWLAKHWVAPEANYLVFDAAHPWPFRDNLFDLVMCHDAFYFFDDKPSVAARLRALRTHRGMLAVSHLHNSEYWGGSKGPAQSVEEWSELFPNAKVYAEVDLIWSLMRGTAPSAAGWVPDHEIEAFSLIEGAHGAPKAVQGGIAVPPPGAKLRRNPLLRDGVGGERVQWPSERYRNEYTGLSYWQNDDDEFGPDVILDPARLRRVVHLPERW